MTASNILTKARNLNSVAVTKILAEYNERINQGWTERESRVMRDSALRVVALTGKR